MPSNPDYVAVISSEKTKWLRSNYLNAYLLLSVIAERARRSKDELSGLEAGDCMIGREEGAKAAGISEDQFRTALDRLIKLNFVKIVFNPKKTAKNIPTRILKIPMKCLVVNICNSEVFDIYLEDSKKQTPDILASIMGETIKQERDKEIKPSFNKAIKQAENPIERYEPEKEKATFNLSKKLLTDLEDCWMQIRKMRGDKKISKTDIVERAVKECLKDFDLKKEKSLIYKYDPDS